MVLGGPNYDELARWRDIVIARAAENPGLVRVDSDLRETQPQVLVRVDTDRAASLGVTARSIGTTLQTMMSERQVTTYVVDGEEYDVVLQAKPEQRATYNDLRNIFVRSDRSGELIPLSNLTRLEDMAGPGQFNRHNRLRAITITANLAPGYTLGEALDYLENVVRTELPATAQIDYRGESRRVQRGIGRAVLYVRHRAVRRVPRVGCAVRELRSPARDHGDGAVGRRRRLARAHAREHDAQHLQPDRHHHARRHRGEERRTDRRIHQPDARRRMEFQKAIVEAARIRFRPVIMTAIAMTMGAVPLILATGPGAQSRSALGVGDFLRRVVRDDLHAVHRAGVLPACSRATRARRTRSRTSSRP